MSSYDKKKWTTIRISKETYDILASQGNVSESFETVLNKLLKNQKKKKGVNNQ